MEKRKIFQTRHIKVEIRPPQDKALDITDEYDLLEAKWKIFREWQIINDDVAKFFNIIRLELDKGRPPKELI